MARLIDADKLREKDMNGDVVDIFDVLEAPTVEAIPIACIEEIISLARTVGATRYAEELEVLIEDWREENGKAN